MEVYRRGQGLGLVYSRYLRPKGVPVYIRLHGPFGTYPDEDLARAVKTAPLRGRTHEARPLGRLKLTQQGSFQGAIRRYEDI